MTIKQATPEEAKAYVDIMRASACGILEKVCSANGINLAPKSGQELSPIPVYEESTSYNLLTTAQQRHVTNIRWATGQNFNFLPAYFKKYRVDNRIHSEVVVTTDNYCLARFFAAKELMHCFLDDDGHGACNAIQEVNELIECLASGGGRSFTTLQPSHLVDEIAWIGACEYLVPASWMDLLNKIHANITAEEPNVNAYLHVAQLIRVPEIIVRVRLRQLNDSKQSAKAKAA